MPTSATLDALKSHVPVFSPACKLVLEPVEVSLDFLSAVPERFCYIIHGCITQALAQLGIDPKLVLFSGYLADNACGFAEKVRLSRLDLQDSLVTLAKEANRRHSDGYFDRHPEVRDSYGQRIADLKAKIANAKPMFYFSDIEGLLATELNPIAYAGIDGEIGIYDRAALLALDIEAVLGDPYAIEATLEEVEFTLLARFQPYYFDINDNPL